MIVDSNDLVNSILESLSRISHIKPDEIPNIDLYMDQVTTLMDRKLKNSTRYPEEDKVLTKTMINNYAKNDLLPPPVKKKYSKEHVLLLIFIYYYKGILSINDIQTLLKPITDKYFNAEGEVTLQSIYEEVFGMEEKEIEELKEDVKKKYAMTQETFKDLEDENVLFLRQFSFICILSYDVYVKKLIIEKIIDEMRQQQEKVIQKPEKKEKDKEKEKV